MIIIGGGDRHMQKEWIHGLDGVDHHMHSIYNM